MPAGHGLLKGRVALVTGAGRNIGRATVFEMLREGADVVYTDCDAARLATLRDDLRPYEHRTHGFLSDVSNPGDNISLVESIDRLGLTIDLLVNNVGIQYGPRSIVEFEWDEYRTVLDSNVIGPCHLTSLAVQRLVARQAPGSVIFMVSLHAASIARRPSYSASKGAITMIVRELAVDLAPHRIRVNGIAPGFVWESPGGDTTPHPYVPLGHCSVAPRYIARAACVLAADEFSAHTTGSIVTVDGGLSLFNHMVADDPGYRRA